MDSSLGGVKAACLPLAHDMMAMACCLHRVYLTEEIFCCERQYFAVSAVVSNDWVNPLKCKRPECGRRIILTTSLLPIYL